MRRTKSRATRTKFRRCAAGSIEDYPTRLGFRGMRAFSPRCLQCREQRCCHAASRVQHCCSAALIRAHFFGPLPTHAMQAKQTWTARLETLCQQGVSVTTVRCRPSVPMRHDARCAFSRTGRLVELCHRRSMSAEAEWPHHAGAFPYLLHLLPAEEAGPKDEGRAGAKDARSQASSTSAQHRL